MEPIALIRNDVVTCSSLHRHCLTILHSAKKKQDKLAVGDDAGIIQCAQLKGRTVSTVFKNPALRRSITAFTSCGDRIYAAVGHNLLGLTKKKGQQFLSYATPLSEDISFVEATESTLFTACEFSVSSFTLPTKDSPTMNEGLFWQARDRIQGFVILTSANTDGSSKYDNNNASTEYVVVGTADRILRLISLKTNESIWETRLSSVIHTLRPYANNPTSFLYGTETGIIGIMTLQNEQLVSQCELSSSQHRQSVTAITSIELSKRGVMDLVIGYDDGTLLVYSGERLQNEISSAFSSTLSLDDGLIYSTELHESIVALESGHIQSAENYDIVVATYSGKILTIGLDPTPINVFSKLDKVDKVQNERNKVTVNLQSDIDDLNSKLQIYKDKLSQITKNTVTPLASVINNNMQAEESLSSLSIKSNLRLIEEEACHLLTVEIPQPIELCVLQSTGSIEFLDSDNTRAIRSLSSSDNNSHNTITNGSNPSPFSTSSIACYRMTEVSHRLETKVRLRENHDCSYLTAYVIPRSINNNNEIAKLSNSVCHAIKPLALHVRADDSTTADDLAAAGVVITGNFSAIEAQSWLRDTLPAFPPATTSDAEQVVTYAQCTYLLRVQIKYRRGCIDVRSINPSSLAAIKQTCSEVAVQRKCKIDIAYVANPKQLNTYLLRLKSVLEHEFGLARKNSMLAALEELELHEGGMEQLCEFLQPELRHILANREVIRQSMQTSPAVLARLTALLQQAYIDQFALQYGRDVSRHLPKLDQILSSATFSFENLVQFMSSA